MERVRDRDRVEGPVRQAGPRRVPDLEEHAGDIRGGVVERRLLPGVEVDSQDLLVGGETLDQERDEAPTARRNVEDPPAGDGTEDGTR
jgi:hypothetical protein